MSRIIRFVQNYVTGFYDRKCDKRCGTQKGAMYNFSGGVPKVILAECLEYSIQEFILLRNIYSKY